MTLIEMAIVLAIMGVLVSVVLLGRGFIQSSRTASAAQFVNTVRDAARSYAARVNGSRDFAGVSWSALGTLELLPPQAATPWGQVPAVDAWATDASYLSLRLCVPSAVVCDDLRVLLGRTAREARCDEDQNDCAHELTVVSR